MCLQSWLHVIDFYHNARSSKVILIKAFRKYINLFKPLSRRIWTPWFFFHSCVAIPIYELINGSRLDSLPSANLRQQKLEQQRQLVEQKQKQKRAQQVFVEWQRKWQSWTVTLCVPEQNDASHRSQVGQRKVPRGPSALRETGTSRLRRANAIPKQQKQPRRYDHRSGNDSLQSLFLRVSN